MRLLVALTCAIVSLAGCVSPDASPDRPAAAPALDGSSCILTAGNPVCHFECEPTNVASVTAARGAAVSARCGHAVAACEDNCSAQSRLPALQRAEGHCMLEHGPSGTCSFRDPRPPVDA